MVEDRFLLIVLLIIYSVCFLGLLIIGVSVIKWNWFMSSVNYAGHNQVCLTFDDGPAEYTVAILDVLKKHGVKAAFFVIGHKCEEQRELLKRIIAEGHLIGNHSYSHTNNLGWASTGKIREEIEQTNMIIKNSTGLAPRYFRPPFGVTNPNIASAVGLLGMKSVGWSIRTYDTVVKDADRLVSKVNSRLNQKGNIILMHDTCKESVEALEKIIFLCKKRGMNIVTIDEIKQ